MASFAGHGVYHLSSGKWELLAVDPQGTGERDRNGWAHLAEENGVVAYATVPRGKTGLPATSVALWLSHGAQFARVPLW